MKILKHLLFILFSNFFYNGQQLNIYADCIWDGVLQSVNPSFVVQNKDIAGICFDIGNFDILPLGGESEKQILCADRQVRYFNPKSIKNFSSFSGGQKTSYSHSRKDIKSVQEFNDDVSYVFKENSNNGTETVQKHLYEFNVSFKEINDFKIGIHILLLITIAYWAKKTYNLISR